MTSYETQIMLGTGFSPLVTKGKGDVNNRVSCSGEQIKNNLKTFAKDTVVIGGTVAGIAATKNGGVAKFLAKPIEALGNGLSKMTRLVNVSDGFTIKNLTIGNVSTNIKLPKFKFKKVPTVFSKAGEFIKKMPTRYKAIALIASASAVTLGHITNKHWYKAGQIDQKYTDKATLKEKVSNTI